MRRIAASAFALCLLVLPPTGAAQAPTDFSGSWTLNVAASNFGGMPAPASLTQTITQDAASVKAAVKQTGDFGEMAFEFTFTTDGKESVNQAGEMQVKSTAKWDGPALVIDSTMDVQGSPLTMSDRWSLAADGKQLTIDRNVSGPMGSGVAKIVFDKQ